MKFGRYVGLVLGIAVLGCAGGDDAATRDAANGATAGAEASPAPAARGDGTRDVRLTRQNVERWMLAIEELGRLIQTNPQLAEQVEIGSEESGAAAAARFRRHPPIVQALGRHGFTPEEYVGLMQNMVGAMFAQGMLEGGHIQELPPEVNEADVRFIAENKDWITERWKRLEQLGVQGDGADDEEYDEDQDDAS